MGIGRICNREVVFAHPDMSVRAAAQLMREYHVGTLVVAEEADGGQRKPVGILTDRDITVGLVFKGLDAEQLRVSEVMGPQLLTLRDGEGVSETMELMHARGIRRVPVVDQQGFLIGIVTVDDLVELMRAVRRFLNVAEPFPGN